MKKLLVFSVIIGTLFLLSACNNEAKEVEKVDASASTQSEDKDKDETVKDETVKEEEEKPEEENLKIPSDEEVKSIIEKSYKLLEYAKEFFEQNQQGNHEAFLTALRTVFSESYISTLNPADFGIATSDNFPTGFDYEKHFVIQSRTADSLMVEVSQEGFEFEELIYTIGAVKENGEWKIDTLDYRYNETADTSSVPGLVTEDEAREIVNNYLSSYKEYEVADISIHDENTFFIEAYVYASEEHMRTVFLAMDRSTGMISPIDIMDEAFFGS